MKTALHIFNVLFPFAATLLLLRMTSPYFNPAGILAIIPIFYYSLVQPRDWFLPAAFLGVMALDYNMGLNLFWTISFAAAYAAGSLQSYINPQSQKHSSLLVFSAFLGACMLCLGISGAFSAGSVRPLFQAAWIVLWCGLLYIPFANFAKRPGK